MDVESTWEGAEIVIERPEDRAPAIEAAFDYRGDVTIRLATDESLEGYVSNRDIEAGTVTLWPADETPCRTLEAAQIVAIAFTGKDTAAGKSFGAWLKKYEEKRARQFETHG